MYSLRAVCALQVVQRCADVASWEGKRRQASFPGPGQELLQVLPPCNEVLKESFQPAVAYLMCDAPTLVYPALLAEHQLAHGAEVVVFLTRDPQTC